MKRPAFQWYPGDHRRDTALQACSFQARALWREMLDLMHDGEPYGHLTAGGVAITEAGLARMIGEPVAKIRRWLGELETRKVFSRTDAGVIFSRRMVRDEHVREVRASAGRLGGEASVKLRGNGSDLPKQNAEQTPEQTTEHRGKQTGNDDTPPAVAVASAVAVAEATTGGRLARCADAWTARYGGRLPDVARAPLERLISQHGEPETFRRWCPYLEKTDGRFASASRFEATWGMWDDVPGSSGERSTSVAGASPPALADAEAAWKETERTLLPRWHRHEMTADEYQRLPAPWRDAISKVGGLMALANAKAERWPWIRKDFIAAYVASDATVTEVAQDA